LAPYPDIECHSFERGVYIMEKNIKHFKITVTLENKDMWETIRHTRKGVSTVMHRLWKDENVAKFSITEVLA
jgi:hypothetical protein